MIWPELRGYHDMEDLEKQLRESIIHTLKVNYPNSMNGAVGYEKFLQGEKTSIDTWIGDCFPNTLRKFNIQRDYEYWRAKLFFD